MKDIFHLDSLKKEQSATILEISEDCNWEIRQRLLDLGFIRGTKIYVQNISPLGDPIAFNVRNTLISLRKEDVKKILVKK